MQFPHYFWVYNFLSNFCWGRRSLEKKKPRIEIQSLLKKVQRQLSFCLLGTSESRAAWLLNFTHSSEHELSSWWWKHSSHPDVSKISRNPMLIKSPFDRRVNKRENVFNWGEFHSFSWYGFLESCHSYLPVVWLGTAFKMMIMMPIQYTLRQNITWCFDHKIIDQRWFCNFDVNFESLFGQKSTKSKSCKVTKVSISRVSFRHQKTKK